MGRLEIELNEQGELVGDAPEGLAALFKRTEMTAYNQGYGKGVQKAAEDAKKQIEDNVKAELAKREALAPLEKEKWSRIEEENTSLKTRIAEAMRDADRTMKSREETHARELLERAEALKRREERILDLTKASLRALAVGSGAREESLTELEVILGAGIAFDEDMEPVVVDEAGEPRMLHGKPMPLSAYVKDYLDTHPHHRKPAATAGGNARGGATYHGYQPGSTVSLDAARRRIHDGDRSPSAIDELFQASRRKQAG